MVLWQPLITRLIAIQTINLHDGYQVGIIRELNKKSLIYCYFIYTIDTWFVLAINNPTLMFMHCLGVYHVYTMR